MKYLQDNTNPNNLDILDIKLNDDLLNQIDYQIDYYNNPLDQLDNQNNYDIFRQLNWNLLRPLHSRLYMSYKSTVKLKLYK